MEQHLVDIESTDFTFAESVDCVGYVRHKLGKTGKVVVRHRLARLLSLRLPGHELRLLRAVPRRRVPIDSSALIAAMSGRRFTPGSR